MSKPEIAIIHNIVTHYRHPLYEKLAEKMNITVYYCSERKKGRQWDMWPRKYNYNYEILGGFTIFNFGKGFPGTNRPLTMIEPLIYLSNKEAVDEMLFHPNPKIALDEFWLGITGNVERSRELIRIYYSRVLYANFFFSSFREGWKTERGMIYIIYGPPDKLAGWVQWSPYSWPEQIDIEDRIDALIEAKVTEIINPHIRDYRKNRAEIKALDKAYARFLKRHSQDQTPIAEAAE